MKIEKIEVFVQNRPLKIDKESVIGVEIESLAHLKNLQKGLMELKQWRSSEIEQLIKKYVNKHDLKLKDIGPIIRLALVGKSKSISIYSVMEILGQSEVTFRIKDFCHDKDIRVVS